MRIPRFFNRLFPNQIWSLPTQGTPPTVYLTFDDGPVPEVTEWVLQTLEAHDVQATFFCIGDNIRKHPEIFKKIILGKHTVGNHSYNHLQGWKTPEQTYLENVHLCQQEIEKHVYSAINYFRPPYGKIRPNQVKSLCNQGYKIVMWEIISRDFDPKTSPEQCFKLAVKGVRNGSILVFHDSHKASKNLYYALPRTIAFLKSKGFVFKAL